MTDKQSFLDRLTAALINRGISETDIKPYIERFDRFYDRMASSPEDISPDVLSDVESIADNIAAQITERYDEITQLTERTMTINRVSDQDEAASADDVPEAGPVFDEDVRMVPESTPAPEELRELPLEDAPTEIIETGDIISVDDNPTEERQAVPTALDEEDEEDIYTRLPDYVEEEPVPNTRMFWILFAITLPITIPLALAVTAVFAAVWAGLAALIVACIALLICGVALGTALSLVGIIYGIVQLFSTLPIGLYEIGIGIIIAGVVMFCGILLYNFAIRFLPFIMRMFGKLFRFLLKKLKVLFNFLRRECAKL